MKKIIKPLLILLIILVGGLFLVKPIINKLSYGIDLQGGFEILYNIEPLEEGRTLTSEDITKTYDAIVKRIDTLGVSEPVITVLYWNILSHVFLLQKIIYALNIDVINTYVSHETY